MTREQTSNSPITQQALRQWYAQEHAKLARFNVARINAIKVLEGTLATELGATLTHYVNSNAFAKDLKNEQKASQRQRKQNNLNQMNAPQTQRQHDFAPIQRGHNQNHPRKSYFEISINLQETDGYPVIVIRMPRQKETTNASGAGIRGAFRNLFKQPEAEAKTYTKITETINICLENGALTLLNETPEMKKITLEDASNMINHLICRSAQTFAVPPTHLSPATKQDPNAATYTLGFGA